MSDQTPLSIGIAGLGRSGWNIHANALANLSQLFKVTAVADPDAERRHEAVERFGCKAYATYEEMLRARVSEIIVVATPNALHPQNAIQAMQTGHHVICEKPLAANSSQVDEILKASRVTQRLIIPFQNRRYEALFVKLRDIVFSGVLGRIVQINLAIHSFARRWDWQTLREFNGGQLNNTGPHFIDQLLQLCPSGPLNIFCRMDRAIASGDAEDHVTEHTEKPAHEFTGHDVVEQIPKYSVNKQFKESKPDQQHTNQENRNRTDG